MNALTLILAIVNLILLAYLIRRPAPSGTVRTLNLGPDDLLVIQTDRKTTADMAATLKEQWATASGTTNTVVVMEPGLDLTVIRNGQRQIKDTA